MKVIISIILSLLVYTYSFASTSQLQKSCDSFGGQMTSKIQCLTSGKSRDGQFCILKRASNNKPEVFFNGCTKSLGGYGEVFHEACIEHDLCYHQPFGASELTKQDCDSLFYQDMLEICKGDTTGIKGCNAMAYTFYSAVFYFGKKSWKCTN